jgi:hypothetical protein
MDANFLMLNMESLSVVGERFGWASCGAAASPDFKLSPPSPHSTLFINLNHSATKPAM